MSAMIRLFALLALLVPGVAFAPSVASAQPIPGAGCPKNASPCTVTATGETAPYTAADWMASVSVVPVPNAKGDGVTDDTAAIQAALNTLAAGQVIGLRAGATYCAALLSGPNLNPGPIGIVALGGQATIKACTGTPAYIIANYNWVNNVAFAAYPTIFSNIVFDGNSRAAVDQYDVTFQSRYYNVRWKGATGRGYASVSTTQNGTALGNGTSNNIYLNCEWDHNGSDGYYGAPLNANLFANTDGHLIGSYIHDNGGYGINNNQMAGWSIIGTHTYSNTSGNFLSRFGLRTFVGSGNVFEDAVTIDRLDTTDRAAILGPGNDFGGVVSVGFTDNSVQESLTSLGNVYSNNGQLKQAFNGQNHVLITSNDKFFQNIPLLWAGDQASTGQIFAVNSTVYSTASGNAVGFLNGLQFPTASSQPMGPQKMDFSKGLSTSGTTTTLVATVLIGNIGGGGFTTTGTLDVWSNNGGIIENYTADIQINYVRLVASATVASSARLTNAYSTGVGVSAAIAIVNTVATAGVNTATVTITITHPQGNNLQDSQAFLHVDSNNRAVAQYSWQ